MKTKIIANYLPQFHEIKENDKWWGKGYTDWVAVKNSEPLYKNHHQPNVPMNDNYYDLSKVDDVRWQAKIANEYGIYGFGIYHYWFNSQLHLLDKPVEIIKDNEDIQINYMFIWDNSTWKRTWSNVEFSNDWAPLYENGEYQKQNNDRGILAELVYGDEKDWKIHFDYLLDYFNDSRYIKIDNRPVFAIYNQNNDSDKLTKMCEFWDQLAKENGFNGIFILGKKNNMNIDITKNTFLYEPEWSGWLWHNLLERIMSKIHVSFYKTIKHPVMYSYDKVYKRILREAQTNNDINNYYSCFVKYDDTPRRGINGKIVYGATPQKFRKYLKKMLNICNEQNKEFLFVTAWNEWGEGAYLEPDKVDGYKYLEAICDVIKEEENVR